MTDILKQAKYWFGHAWKNRFSNKEIWSCELFAIETMTKRKPINEKLSEIHWSNERVFKINSRFIPCILRPTDHLTWHERMELTNNYVIWSTLNLRKWTNTAFHSIECFRTTFSDAQRPTVTISLSIVAQIAITSNWQINPFRRKFNRFQFSSVCTRVSHNKQSTPF